MASSAWILGFTLKLLQRMFTLLVQGQKEENVYVQECIESSGVVYQTNKNSDTITLGTTYFTIFNYLIVAVMHVAVV